MELPAGRERPRAFIPWLNFPRRSGTLVSKASRQIADENVVRIRLKFTHFRPIRPSGAACDFGRRKRDQNEFTGSRTKGLRNKRRQSCPKLSSGNAHPLRASGN